MSTTTVKRAMRALESAGVLQVYRKQSPDGNTWRNRYSLRRRPVPSPRRDTLRQDVVPALQGYLRQRQAQAPHELIPVSATQIAHVLNMTPYYVGLLSRSSSQAF